MDKIDADSILTHLNEDPNPVAVANVSDLFKDDTLTITDPNANVQGWLAAQGWKYESDEVVDSVTIGGETVNITKVYYTKRVLDTELALQSLVSDYTDALNEGRSLNDQRYDDIVALYLSSLDKTEDEINDLEDDEDSFEDLSLTLVNTLAGSYNTHKADVEDDLDSWGDAQRERVDDAMDAQLAEQEDSLIDRGLYNSFNLNAMQTGVESERTSRDTELEDQILSTQLKHKDRLYSLSLQVDNDIIAARDRVFARIHGEGVARISLRNQVIDLVCRFAERRTDSYPSMESIGNLAIQLGAGLPSSNLP